MDKKIQYAVYKRETGDAGGKAKCDAFDIVREMGFLPSYNPSEHRVVRIMQQILSMHKFNGHNIVFVQYPAVAEQLLQKLYKHIKHSISIALVHDLLAIQYGRQDITNEIANLNHFTYVIVHNDKMREFLESNGLKSKTICLEAFDYLHDVNRDIVKEDFSNTVCFAGNLTKSEFVTGLSAVNNVNFKLYGVKSKEQIESASNIEYCGCLPSNEIVYSLSGDYGLVWDGTEINTCGGGRGEYLRYNNPHKMSLYISAGKPIITWKQAAIADFVLSNKIGIVVESLEELNQINLRENYEIFKNNILKLKSAVGEGCFLKTAITKATHG